MKYTSQELDEILSDVDNGKFEGTDLSPKRLAVPDGDLTDILSIPSDESSTEVDVFERLHNGDWREVC